MLLIVEKSIKSCHAVCRYAEANNIRKDYDKYKKPLSIQIQIIFMDRLFYKSYSYVVLNGLKIDLNLLKIL